MLEDLSARSFFIMCLMCKIMDADSPREATVDPADSCKVSTQPASLIIGTKGKARVSTAKPSALSLPLRHYPQLHIQMAACL